MNRYRMFLYPSIIPVALLAYLFLLFPVHAQAILVAPFVAPVALYGLVSILLAITIPTFLLTIARASIRIHPLKVFLYHAFFVGVVLVIHSVRSSLLGHAGVEYTLLSIGSGLTAPYLSFALGGKLWRETMWPTLGQCLRLIIWNGILILLINKTIT